MSFPKFRVGLRLLQLALLLLCATPAVAQDISVQLDGRTLQFDQPPAMIGGRLMVPLRGIFEALKADVVYDGATRSIQATKGTRVVQLQLGSRTAIIDGKTMFLDVPADTIGGRTMVPLRFVSESLGADVKWDGPAKTVRMSSSTGDSDTNPDTGNQTGGPKIDQVFHNATHALQAGDSLEIIVYGEPGSKASFEIMGATSLIQLPEVSSGKYQLRWTIPNGLQVEQGVLLAHLQKNGRETAVEAQRQVTVRSGSGSTTPSGWQVTPAADSVTADYRPAFTADFPESVTAGTVRLYVDGIDFTNQARLVGRQLQWQPNYNLSAGSHQVDVRAVGASGQSLSYNWNFRIDPNASTGSGFQVSELRPTSGQTVSSRPQIGVLFNRNLQSITLRVDNTTISNQAGVTRYQNGIFWTPNYDLAVGQHQASVSAVDTNGQVINQSWAFVVGSSTITNFTVSPTSATSGQQIIVSLNGPSSATGTFTIGGSSAQPLQEVSAGRYQGTYTVAPQDNGTFSVSAQLRQSSGQVVQATAPTQVSLTGVQGQLSITNLAEGMTVAPNFTIQGQGQAGRTVSITVEYSSEKFLEVITGTLRTVRTQGTVSANGSFNIPVDAGVVPAGQNFRLTANDGVSQPVVFTLKRQ